LLTKRQGDRKGPEFAAEIGISHQGLYAIYNGTYGPYGRIGPKVARLLGLRIVTLYEVVK
jgi:DNA-binding XRE family transcriptional regulator